MDAVSSGAGQRQDLELAGASQMPLLARFDRSLVANSSQTLFMVVLALGACSETSVRQSSDIAVITTSEIDVSGNLHVSGIATAAPTSAAKCVDTNETILQLRDAKSDQLVVPNNEELLGFIAPNVVEVGPGTTASFSFEIGPWKSAYLAEDDFSFIKDFKPGGALLAEVELLFFPCELGSLSSGIESGEFVSFRTDPKKISGDSRTFIGEY